jgi:thymidine kinase
MSSTHKIGRLEVICGSMFSGKTEELIRRIRRGQIARLSVQAFKHSSDNKRAQSENINSHNGDSFSAISVSTAQELKNLLLSTTHIVAIDEVQWFSHDMVTLITDLVDEGKHVIVAGLDLDFRRIPIGCMPLLLALADDVTKLKAVCMECHNEAHFTQRLVDGKPAKFTDPLVLIGAKEFYQARCRACFKIEYQITP